MHPNTIVLNMLQKFGGYFQEIKPRFRVGGLDPPWNLERSPPLAEGYAKFAFHFSLIAYGSKRELLDNLQLDHSSLRNCNTHRPFMMPVSIFIL